jgi:hypothetical protein
MIDINRVHDVLEGRVPEGRQIGKTTAMLVTALGYADFDVPIIYIFCGSVEHVTTINYMLCDLAAELGFTSIVRLTTTTLKVDKTLYILLHRHKQEPSQQYANAPRFYDNYYHECLKMPVPVQDHYPQNILFMEQIRRMNQRYKQNVLGEWE